MECPVCYNSQDNMKDFYDCKHLICCTCHKAWHKNQNTCPICRAPEYNTPKRKYMVHAWCITSAIMWVHLCCINVFTVFFWLFEFEPEYNY